MLTKVIIYAYTQRIYSSRKIFVKTSCSCGLPAGKERNFAPSSTKIGANANWYTFVWGKVFVNQKAKLQEKVQILFAAIEEAEVSMKYLRLKNQSCYKLSSEDGSALTVRRMTEPEPAFGAFKIKSRV